MSNFHAIFKISSILYCHLLPQLKYGMVTQEDAAQFFLGPVTEENFVILC